MHSTITPERGLKQAVKILRELSPRSQMGVQAITACPEFSDKELCVLRTDIRAAFEQVTRSVAEQLVWPKWNTGDANTTKIIRDEFDSCFSSQEPSGHLLIGSSLSPRIYEDYMDTLGWTQEGTYKGVKYYRYVDDFILFDKSPDRLTEAFRGLKAALSAKGFTLSENKTRLSRAGEPYSFLGRTFNSGTQSRIVAPIPYTQLPQICITEEASREIPGQIEINRKYLGEFYPSNTLNGYVVWAALEMDSGKPHRYPDYNPSLGHSRIYSFYLKNIKAKNLEGKTPEIKDSQKLLLALVIHLRELRQDTRTFVEAFTDYTGMSPKDGFELLCTDTKKGSPYHKTIKSLFKREYALRVPPKDIPER